VTVTSTIVETTTHIATQRATIVVARIETSTAVSIIDVTISSAATQTDVFWVSVTTVAEQVVPRQELPQQSEGSGSSLAFRTSQGKKLPHGISNITPIPRQAAQDSTPTVTSYVTQTTDITSISSTRVTVSTTSTVVTTLYQTNTR
jgi:membrane-associated protease RseP (regulator of RpoE activity)